MNNLSPVRSAAPTEFPQHERTDVNPSMIGLSAVGLLAVTFAVLLIVAGVFWRLESVATRTDPTKNPLASPPRMTEPRLQASPAEDLRNMRDEETAVLTNYAWVDRKGGTVRIPIERAIAILSERGFPESKSQTPWNQETSQEENR